MPDSSADQPPALAGFEIIAPAGRGAYGVVWVARDASGRLHAVKVVDAADPIGREAQALALVLDRVPSDPHLVRITHVGRDGPRLAYAMELADPAAGSPPAGSPGYRPDTLAARLSNRERLYPDESVALALDVLAAVGRLHRAGLVHRDIKPHNILFVGGAAKLADIGLTAADRTGLSEVGTPGYLPPDGGGGPDADLYALGMVLYQCLTGLSPGDFPRVPAYLLAQPGADRLSWLNAALLTACGPTRPIRFRTADAFREALQAGPHHSSRPSFAWLAAAAAVGAALAVAGWTAATGGLGFARHAGATTVAVPSDRPVLADPPRATPQTSGWDALETWLVETRPPARTMRQLRLFVVALESANPGYRGRIAPSIDEGLVVGIALDPHGLTDLTPLRALTDAREIDLTVLREGDRGDVSDLGPLRGMRVLRLRFGGNRVTDLGPLAGMPLVELDCHANSVRDLGPIAGPALAALDCRSNPVTDLGPLTDVPLAALDCGGCPVADLTPVRGMPLESLGLRDTPVSDLGPLSDLALERIDLRGVPATDLSPLAGQPVRTIQLDFDPARDGPALRQLPDIRLINGIPATEILD